MSGIYPNGPQGAVPSYRSSNQTVVVHHWHPQWKQADVLKDAYPSTEEPVDDAVIAYNAECSVPLKVVVRETDGTAFRVEDIPTQCPLCARQFSVVDLKRIRGAAVSQHLRVCDWRNDQIVHPTDLILDV